VRDWLAEQRLWLGAARAREMERRVRTGLPDPWWDAPHYVRAWLKQEIQELSDDGVECVERLIIAMRADPDIPHHFPTAKYMREYVRRMSKGDRVDDELAMAAVPSVWRRYRKWGRGFSPRLF